MKKNTFFDINKLPPEKGLLLFGLSMNKLNNRQNARNCLDDIRYFTPSKIVKPFIGLNFIYSDFLYLYSDKPAPELKDSFMNQVINHKNSTQKLIEKNPIEFQIQHAFSYIVWNQLYVGTNDFNESFLLIKRIYEKDELFQKYVKEDCEVFGRAMGENQVNYFLEETLMIYLLSKNRVKLPNEYIDNNQEWILFCYPGRPLKTQIYIYQLDPLKLNWPSNPYQNAFYNLEDKELIKMDEVDLETYTVKS